MIPSANGGSLPINLSKDVILASLATRDCPRLILSAPTGSGKSTQVPQMLIDGLELSGEVFVLQPRRLAARLLADRVARERGARPGGEIGYQVRFESRFGPNTLVRYVTEGILLRRILEDPQLNGIGAVILDEFHERHLYGDITLARLKLIQEQHRPDLRIVVMSATLDIDRLKQYLSPCEIVQSEGRLYPVHVSYSPQRIRQSGGGVWDQVVRACEGAVVQEGMEGDILVFLPGGHEIRRTLKLLHGCNWARGWKILPLHGELSAPEQDAAVRKYSERKIIVATNIAETSITIDGIRLVIDAGLARTAQFDPHRGINTLTVQPISRAAAEQRAGRAGRTSEGRCIRLWSEDDHAKRLERERPEIERTDLSEAVLMLKGQGFQNLERFPWLEPPRRASLLRAETMLLDLGALREAVLPTDEEDSREIETQITEIGRKLLAFPVHPRFGRMLIEAGRLGCVREAALVAALAQGRDLFVKQRRDPSDLTREDYVRKDDTSDFEALLRGLATAKQVDFQSARCRALGLNGRVAREVVTLGRRFQQIAENSGVEETGDQIDGVEALAKTILAGFADQVARRPSPTSGVYDLVHGRRGKLAVGSVAKGKDLMVAVDVAEIEGKELTVILSNATALDIDWLRDVYPDHLQSRRVCRFEEMNRRVAVSSETRFRDLLVASERSGMPTEPEAAAVLAQEVMAGNLVLKHWGKGIDQWIARLNFLKKWMPELELPTFEDEDRRVFLEDMFFGSFSYKDIREREIWPKIREWLSASQRGSLEHFAPEAILLQNGRNAKVHYDEGDLPWIALTVQNLYGVGETPCIADGRVRLLVKVLAPNQRPIQMTSDLEGFWSSGYEEVKRQLKGRYPKHEWR